MKVLTAVKEPILRKALSIISYLMHICLHRLTQTMIVLHEELMEEIYDWLSDAEKQPDSIAVNEDDISSVMEEYGRHRV